MNVEDHNSNEPTEFVITRDRDAWAIIRGYVYQVDLTITRWLQLKAGEILELERGEDIDLIGQFVAAPTEARTRILEQVKLRSRPISLRTPAAISTLANAIEHQNTNPDLDLQFRYTTNAKITAEKVSLTKPAIAALTMWEKIRQGNLSTPIQTDYLSHIEAILKAAECPDNLNGQTWERFKAFISKSDSEDLLRLIRRFQWSTGELSAEQLAPQIQQSLISLGYARDDDAAGNLYQRLFLHVFKVLSCPDKKRLTKDDLFAQLALPTLADGDRLLLSKLTELIDGLEKRVSLLEEGLADTNATMQQIQDKVATAIGGLDITSTIDFVVAHPILEPPLLVSQLSRRVDAVKKLSGQLQQHTWLSIQGGAGTGKTQLAILLSENFGNCRAWVRFRDLNPSQSYARLVKTYEILTRLPTDSEGIDWLKIVSKLQNSNSVIVLDDLPRLYGDEELSECLVALALACRAHGVRIISTSHWSLAQRVKDVLPKGLFISVESPPLSEDEVEEILTIYGAPKNLLNQKFIRFLNDLARRHPALLAATARFLNQRKWKADEEALAVLLKGQHAREVMDETVGRLLKTVEDQESRELLFRLNLIWGSFTQKDVDLVANIKPIVPHASAKLHNLTGLWIQRDIQDEFSLSPLIKAIGGGYLSEQTTHDCHDALGMRILKQRTVDPNDIWEAFGHFLSAKEFGRAGGVLMIAFNSLRRLRTLFDHRGLLDVWINQSMPDGFELAMRIYLRALQISTRAKFSKENGFLLKDLDKLIEKAQPSEGWAVLAAGISLNRVLAKKDPIRANKYMLKGLKLCPQLTGPTGEKLVFPKGLGPEMFFWTTTSTIKNNDDLRNWLNTVGQLTPDQLNNLFIYRHGPDGCLALADKLVREESKKPTETQTWDVVLQGLDELQKWAEKHNIRLLQACATRAKMIVLAEHKEDFDSMMTLGASFLAGPDPDARVRFLIKEMIGQQYRQAGNNEEAIQWLNAALVEPVADFDFEQIETMLNASFAIGDKDPKTAVRYVQNAVAKARSSKGTATMYVIALAELAIAEWMAGYDMAEIFTVWEEAADKLISNKNKDDSWRALYVLFGHCSGYFAHLAERGKPPETIPGAEPYSAPTRRMFFSFNREAAKLYDTTKDILLPAQLVVFASGAKLDEKAATWALRSIDLTRKQSQLQALPIFGFVLIPYLFNTDQYSNALDLALEVSAVSRACYIYETQGGGKTLPLGPDVLNIDSILGARPSDSWRQVEIDSLTVGILPAVLRLNTVALQDRKAAAFFALEAQETCRRIAATSSNPSLWGDLAHILQQIYIDRVSGNELVVRGGKYENQTLMTIAYLGACIQDDINYTTGCEIQLAVMPFVHAVMQLPRSAYRQIVAPFILNYWKSAFEKARFEFSTPNIIERELEVACQVSKDKQPQAILRVISNALGVHPTDQQRTWLANGSAT